MFTPIYFNKFTTSGIHVYTYRYLVWQEVFDNGVEIAKDTVVHVWKHENSPTLWKQEVDEVPRTI